MNATEIREASARRDQITSLRNDLGEVEASVRQMYLDAPDGTRFEQALVDALAALHVATVELGHARDAVGNGRVR